MQYIVLDLEWNQPVSYNSSVYRRVGDSLIFEVIQFGAVKLNDRFEVTDSVSMPVRPTQYTSIHPRVRRMTGLGNKELESAPSFPEAVEQFLAWCGEDYAFVTWGCDDVSVLRQNLDFYHVEREMPPVCDLQKYYAKVFDLGASQKALKAAMEQLEIVPDEQRQFHNALDDAYYTALVLGKLPQPERVLEFPQQPRKLGRGVKRTRMRVTSIVKSVSQALSSDEVLRLPCPTCKEATAMRGVPIYQAPGRYLALSHCKQHGWLFVKLRFQRLPDGQVGMNLSVNPADRQNKAYLHTKELQYQYRKKRGDFDSFDPDDLSAVGASNMPFDD